MPDTGYEAFIESKRRRVPPAGVTVDTDDLHRSLFEHQQHITQWALARGRAAIFADTGLGKTAMQLEWARHIGSTALILAPLSVARQTVREAARIDQNVRYVRHQDDVTGPGVWITNYQMAEHFDADRFDAVVLDESSILKNFVGKTRTHLIEQWQDTKYRLCCTATPAPNDVTELCNHAEFLGIMPRNEMLAAYFVHDDVGWRLKGHAADPMYRWMASWAMAIRYPSDLGYSNERYELPPLNIRPEVVHVDIAPDGQLFATDLGGIGGRSAVRRETLNARCDRTIQLAETGDQWIVWCGLNDEASTIAAALDDAVNVEGSWSPEAKADALEAFQDGDVRVLVTKPAIAGFGMNFQNAHRMAFCGVNDSYEMYYQSIRRCWRFGQTEPVDVHIVVSELEQQIVDNVRRKESEAATMTAHLVHAMRQEQDAKRKAIALLTERTESESA
jgi:superfamily II DNA or RNA helicase